MPRLKKFKQRLHQPIWDTLVRGNAAPSTLLNAQTTIFGNANVGSTALTNLQTAGQLASDQTFAILALRCFLYFNGGDRRVLYIQTASELYFSLQLGESPQFTAPCWFFPAGGGVWGLDSQTSVFTHGEPTQEAILKLARPLLIPVRQAISVICTFYKMGTVDVLNGASPSINTPGTNEECIQFVVDGLKTRDAQ